jgi:hypothetical protein
MPPAPGVARVLVASRNPGGTVQFLALPRPSRATARPDKVARQSILASPDLGVCHGQRTMSAYPKVFRVKDLKRRHLGKSEASAAIGPRRPRKHLVAISAAQRSTRRLPPSCMGHRHSDVCWQRNDAQNDELKRQQVVAGGIQLPVPLHEDDVAYPYTGDHPACDTVSRTSQSDSQNRSITTSKQTNTK